MDRIPSPRILTLDPNDENIILEIPEDVDPSAPVQPAKKEKVITILDVIIPLCTYNVLSQNLIFSFENSVNPDQLASEEAS